MIVMKNRVRPVAILAFLLATLLSQSTTRADSNLLLTGFGSTELNPLLVADMLPDWDTSATVQPTKLTIADGSNFDGGFLVDLALDGRSQVSLGGLTPVSLTLTGALNELTEFAVAVFAMELLDPEFDSVSATFTWTDFSPGGSSVTALLSSNPDFGGTISQFKLALGGLPLETVSFDFDSLSVWAVVPEPSYLLPLLIVLALAACGRPLLHRRKAGRGWEGGLWHQCQLVPISAKKTGKAMRFCAFRCISKKNHRKAGNPVFMRFTE